MTGKHFAYLYYIGEEEKSQGINLKKFLIF